MIEAQGYFLEVSRYLHLNPVRARIVLRPEEYRWGSYPGYRRAGDALEWVTYTRVLGEFGQEPRQARLAYARFVAAGVAERPASPFAGAVGGLLLGSSSFVERIGRLLAGRSADAGLPELKRLRARPSVDEIAELVAGHFGRAPEDWSEGRRSDDASRAVAAYLARRRYGHPATLVAAALGYRDPSSVSHALRRIDDGPASLRRLVEEMEKEWG